MTQFLLPDKDGFSYSEEERLRVILPILEFAVGSCGLSRRQALVELGYEETRLDGLLEDRLAEDLVNNPKTKEVMAEYMRKALRD